MIMIRTRRHMFTAASLSLAAVLALGACSSSIQAQEVPSAGDGKTSTPTSEPTAPSKTVVDVEEVPAPEEGEAGEGDSFIEMKDYFGVVPEDVPVPDAVKAAFPENYDTLVRYALAQQFTASTLRDLQRVPTDEFNASRDLYALALDEYWSNTMRESYHSAFADPTVPENYALLFALSPMAAGDGTFTTADGTILQIDETRFWEFGVNNVVVGEVAPSVNDGIQGVFVTFDRAVYIPVANQSYDIALTSALTVFLVPGVDKAWQVDGVAWSDTRIDNLERE